METCLRPHLIPWRLGYWHIDDFHKIHMEQLPSAQSCVSLSACHCEAFIAVLCRKFYFNMEDSSSLSLSSPMGCLYVPFGMPENVFEGGHGIETWHAQLTRNWQQQVVENKRSVGFRICGVRWGGHDVGMRWERAMEYLVVCSLFWRVWFDHWCQGSFYLGPYLLSWVYIIWLIQTSDTLTSGSLGDVHLSSYIVHLTQ